MVDWPMSNAVKIAIAQINCIVDLANVQSSLMREGARRGRIAPYPDCAVGCLSLLLRDGSTRNATLRCAPSRDVHGITLVVVTAQEAQAATPLQSA